MKHTATEENRNCTYIPENSLLLSLPFMVYPLV